MCAMARGMDLRATLEQDYRIAVRCMQGHDFYEGVRAALIDRDRSPRWQPASLEEVTCGRGRAPISRPSTSDD